MKAFKKWWNNLGVVYQTNPLLSPEDRTKRGWREALEEVLKVAESYEESWDHSVSDWIKEELRDG